MSWLDANEYFIMETAARDRLDDLHASIDRALASADGPDDRPGDTPPGARPRCHAVETGRLRQGPSPACAPVAYPPCPMPLPR
jgi:hypothetical protein